LIEAETGSHVWADKYDGLLNDVFDLQDRVTESVVALLHPKLRSAETERSMRKRPEDLTAYDFYLRALPHAHSISAEGVDRAIDLLDRAIAVDGGFAQAHGLAGWCYVWQLANALPRKADADKLGKQHIERALELDPQDATVLWIAGIGAVYFSREHDHGLELTERSVALNPNSALGWATHGWVQYFGGMGSDQAIESFEAAKRLSPLDPMTWYFHGGIGQAYFAAHRYEEAVRWSERSWRENPHWTAVWRALAGAYAYLGRMDDARRAVEKILDTSPGLTVSGWSSRTPLRAGALRDHFLEGLRLAGLPE
jgi:adenylate cyclase